MSIPLNDGGYGVNTDIKTIIEQLIKERDEYKASVDRMKADANRYRALKPLLFFRLDGYTSESGSIEDATHASWGLETGGGALFETNSGKEPESLDQAIDRMLEGKEGGR